MLTSVLKVSAALLVPVALMAQVQTQVISGSHSDMGGSYMTGMEVVFDMTNKTLVNDQVGTEGLDVTKGISIAEQMWCKGWGWLGGKYTPYAPVPCNEYVTDVRINWEGSLMKVSFSMFHDVDNSSSADYSVQIAYTVDHSDEDLVVYDNALVRGAGACLFTGDGPQDQAGTVFTSQASENGNSFISVTTPWTSAAPGSHLKLMLFANGNAAGYDGIDLGQYSTVKFKARSQSMPTAMAVNIGCADDSGMKNFGIVNLSTEWQEFTFSINDIANRSDINSLVWFVLHKAYIPALPAGQNLQVCIDEVRFVK